MSILSAGLLLDGAVALLLAATLVYCVILERRLSALRSGQDGLKKVVADLDAATSRAQAAIGGLRAAGEAGAAALETKLGPAKALTDELTLMLEAGESLAQRLAHGRAGDAATSALRAAAASARTPAPAQPGEAILRALKDAR